jgi:hypothetical protein
LSRRPGSRDAGISVGRSAPRNRRPPTSYTGCRMGRWSPVWRARSASGHRSAFPRERTAWCGGELHALRLDPAGEVVHLFHRFSREQRVLDLPSSPRPLEAPLTAQLRLSEAEADATCEHQPNRPGEAVLVGLNLGAGEHLLRDSMSDTISDERMDRFQTRVGFAGEKESKCPQKKTQLGDVRF